MLFTRNLNLSLAADGLKQPLHLKIRQLLRERILSDFQEGQRFFSERELMEKLSVSQPTIHRALGDLVDEGYLQREPRRGFFVRRRASQRYVGLVTPGTAAGYEFVQASRNRQCLVQVHAVHREDGLDEVMASIRHKPSEERLLLSGLTVELTLALSARLQAEGYQHLVLGPRIPGFTGGSIANDVEAETDLILDHLVGLGHERIAFIVNEPRNLLLTSQRAGVVERKIKERGLSAARLVFCDTHNWDSSFDAAYRKVGEILAERPWPTALVPLSGVGAWAAERYALRHGIRIPDDISIVSFDPIVGADHLPVMLTELTISQEERAEAAVSALWSERVADANLLIRPGLVVRESSGPAARA